jgi:hypothetical protein
MIRLPIKACNKVKIYAQDGYHVAAICYNIGRQRYIKYNGSRSGRPISEADFEALEKSSEMSRRRAHYYA